jgi:hypothetical protein
MLASGGLLLKLAFLSVFSLLVIQSNAQPTRLKCTITEMEVRGQIFSIAPAVEIYTFDDGDETLQLGSTDCTNVSITADSIDGVCGGDKTHISRTSGRIHIPSDHPHGCSGRGCNQSQNRDIAYTYGRLR